MSEAKETPAPDALGALPSAASSPYKNLFVPLVVVPALIVGAIVLVFVFFGAIAGREASLEENLDRVVSGGAGDHTQAAFNMVRQLAENQEARSQGRDEPWPVSAAFLPRLRSAWKSTPPDEHRIRLVLASLLARFEDPEGIPSLVALLDTPPGEDQDGFVRFNAIATLGALADERAVEPIVRFLEAGQEDEGLRSVAAIALQRMPGERSQRALVAALEDSSLEVRGNAAIALATRGDPAGASVLCSLLDRANYQTEHERNGQKFSQARRISEARVKAVEALARLKRTEDRVAIAAVAEADGDLAVREAAMKALEGWR